MRKILAIAAVMTLWGVPVAQAQTSDHETEAQRAHDAAAARDQAGPATPADVPNWMAHAIGNILDDTGKAVDDATHDHR